MFLIKSKFEFIKSVRCNDASNLYVFLIGIRVLLLYGGKNEKKICYNNFFYNFKFACCVYIYCFGKFVVLNHYSESYLESFKNENPYIDENN